MIIPVTRTLLALIALALVACSPSAESPAPRKPAPTPAAAPAPPPPPSRSFSSFRPSIHGFRFVNSFSGSPLPFSLGGLEKHLNLPNRFGLCGGMSFAAADFFLAELDMPSLAKPPTQGDALYDYLYTRQIDSLGENLAFVPRFAQWMDLPDLAPAGASFLTYAALPQILSRLENGEPTLLGLVLTSTAKRGQLWENHQVLAFAADVAPGNILIRIYDPNYPDSDSTTLRLTPRAAVPLVVATGIGGLSTISLPWMGMHTVRTSPGRRETPVRGFFQMPYTPKLPPASARSESGS